MEGVRRRVSSDFWWPLVRRVLRHAFDERLLDALETRRQEEEAEEEELLELLLMELA